MFGGLSAVVMECGGSGGRLGDIRPFSGKNDGVVAGRFLYGKKGFMGGKGGVLGFAVGCVSCPG